MIFLKKIEKIPYAILLVILALISYSTIVSDFLFIDDTILIVNNPQLKFTVKNILSFFTNPLGRIFDDDHYQIMFIYYRPLLNILYTLNKAIWGINPVGFHISNLILHLLTSIMIYRTGLILLNNNRLLSLMAAALFCAHPAHNEIVARVAMNENLLGLFISVALYFYFAGRSRLSLFFFSCALLTKESAIMLPLVIFLFEFINKRPKEAFKSIKPYAVLILFYLIVRAAVVGIPDQVTAGGSILQSILAAVVALTFYIRIFIFPYPLSVFYPTWKYSSLFQSELLLAFSIVILLGITLWKIRDRSTLFSLLLSGLILLFPVTIKANEMIIGLDRAFIAERQLYTPAIFFVLFVAVLIDNTTYKHTQRSVAACFFIVLPFFIFMSAKTNVSWINNDVLTEIFVKSFPSGIIAHKVKGMKLLRSGDADGAIAEFNALLPVSNNVVPRLRQNMGQKTLVFKGIDEYNEVAAYQPVYADLHYYLGCAYMVKNDQDRAVKKFKTCLILDPHLTEARTVLAGIYMKNKMYKEASKEYKLALMDIEKHRQ